MQCGEDEPCSKNNLCYFHIAVSQADVVLNIIRRKVFSLGLQYHPRDKFASADFLLIGNASSEQTCCLFFLALCSKKERCTCPPDTALAHTLEIPDRKLHCSSTYWQWQFQPRGSIFRSCWCWV